jgi:hypothetical protein
MGQYWFPVNLDKMEKIHPHKLGCGLKLYEQVAGHPGVGAALVILCAAEKEERGGGDLDLTENWHGPERTFPEYGDHAPPLPDGYDRIAKETIGRWAGDRIVLIGDYAEKDDISGVADATGIVEECIDVSDQVIKIIEHELCGKFVGDGWAEFKRIERS